MRFEQEAILRNGFLSDSEKDSCANFRCDRKPGLRALSHSDEPVKRKQSRLLFVKVSSSHSQAFTILEMLIVLVILVAMLAIAWPQISRRIQRSDLKQTALTLKEEISEARTAAIESGETWKLQFGEWSNRYEWGPVSTFRQQKSDAPTIQVGRQSSELQSDDTVAQKSVTVLDSDFLLTTISKEKLVAENDDRFEREPETIQIGGGEASEQNVNKGKEILFFPDGRATETNLILVDTNAQTGIEIKVRGLTGQVEIGKFLKIETEFKRASDEETVDSDTENLDLELGE